MIEDGALDAALEDRSEGWQKPRAQAMLGNDLAAMTARVLAEGINPTPRSGRQKILENYVSRIA